MRSGYTVCNPLTFLLVQMARISLVDEKSVGALVQPGKDCMGSTVLQLRWIDYHPHFENCCLATGD